MLVTGPVTGPRKVTAKKSRPTTAAKGDFFRILRTAGVPEETIKATDEHLQDPIDLKRDAVFLVRHGLDREQLMSRMGGSP
jgi:hypothetical protein